MLGLTMPERGASPVASAVCNGRGGNRTTVGDAWSDPSNVIEGTSVASSLSERHAWQQRLSAVSVALEGALAAGQERDWDFAPPPARSAGAASSARRAARRKRHPPIHRVLHTGRYTLAKRTRGRLSKRSITVSTVANVLRQLSHCAAPFTHGSQLALDLYAAASGDEVSPEVRTVLRKCGAVLDQLSSLIPQVFYLQMVCNGFRIAADTLDGKPLMPEDGVAMMTLLSQIITMRSRLPTSYLTPSTSRLAAHLTPSTGRLAARLAGTQLASASAGIGARNGLRLMAGARTHGLRYRLPSRATRPMRHRSDSEVAVVYPGKVIPGEPSQRPVWGAREEVRTSISFSRPETNKYQDLGSRAGLSDFTAATRDVHAWIGMYRESLPLEESSVPPLEAEALPSVATATVAAPVAANGTERVTEAPTAETHAAETGTTDAPLSRPSTASSMRSDATTLPPATRTSTYTSGSTTPDATTSEAAASNVTRESDSPRQPAVASWFPNGLMSAEGLAILEALEQQSDPVDFKIAYVNQVPVRTRWPNETQWEPIPLLEYRVPGVSVRGRRQGERFLYGRSDYVSLGPFAVGVREIMPGKLWMIDRRVHHGTRLPHYPLVRDGASWRPRRATTTPALEANGPSTASDGFVRYLNRKFIDFSNVRVDVPRTVIDDEEPIADLAQRVERMLPGAYKTQVIYTDRGSYLIEGEYGYYTLGYHDPTQSFYVTGKKAGRVKREVPVFFDTRLRRWVVTHNPYYAEDEHERTDPRAGAEKAHDRDGEGAARNAFATIDEMDEVDEVVDAFDATTPSSDIDGGSEGAARLPERVAVSGAFDSGRSASTWANASIPLAGHPSEPHNVRVAHGARLADKAWGAEWSAILGQMQGMRFFSAAEGHGDIRTRLYIALANTFASMHYDLPLLNSAFVNASDTVRAARGGDNVAAEMPDDMTMQWRRQIAPFYPPPDRWAHMSLQQRQRQVGLLLRLAYPEEGSLRTLCGERDCGVAAHAFHAGLVDADTALRDHYLELALVDRRAGRRHPMLLYVDDPQALKTFTHSGDNATRIAENPPHLSPIELCHFLVARTGTMLLIDVARPARLWEFDQVTTVETAARHLVAVLERRGFGQGLNHDFSAVAEVPAYASAQASYRSAAARSRRLLFQALRRRGGDNCYAGLCVARNTEAAAQNVSHVVSPPEALLAQFGQGAALPQGASIETMARDVEAVSDEGNLPQACVPLFGALASALPQAHGPALRAALSRLTLGALFHVDQARRANDEEATSRMVVACGVIGEALHRLLIDEKA